VERLSNSRKGAAEVQLAQQSQSTDIKHALHSIHH
jgi:hypothetical protein